MTAPKAEIFVEVKYFRISARKFTFMQLTLTRLIVGTYAYRIHDEWSVAYFLVPVGSDDALNYAYNELNT